MRPTLRVGTGAADEHRATCQPRRYWPPNTCERCRLTPRLCGRFHIDSTQIAAAQLCLGIFGSVFSLFCLLGFPVSLGSIIWAIVDAIMMFTGSVKDNRGRKLR
jgi:hypothetical protein